MAEVFEGRLEAGGLRFAIVVSRWNSFITERMLDAAKDTLVRHGAPEDAIEVTRGLGELSLQTGIPITYGVLTVENIEQAIERAGTKAGNKGAEAALAAIEMANLLKTLDAV